MQKPLIEVRNLVKIYQTPAGDFTAVDGLDVDVHRGEFVSIIGQPASPGQYFGGRAALSGFRERHIETNDKNI